MLHFVTFLIIYMLLYMWEGNNMTFNLQKFSVDIKEYRQIHNLTQKEFASKLELDNHTLISLFEQGKRAPSKDVFANYCQITNHRSEEYWDTNDSKPMAFLMGKISETDEKNLLDVLEKIGMREYLFALYNRVTK